MSVQKNITDNDLVGTLKGTCQWCKEKVDLKVSYYKNNLAMRGECPKCTYKGPLTKEQEVQFKTEEAARQAAIELKLQKELEKQREQERERERKAREERERLAREQRERDDLNARMASKRSRTRNSNRTSSYVAPVSYDSDDDYRSSSSSSSYSDWGSSSSSSWSSSSSSSDSFGSGSSDGGGGSSDW